MGMHAHLQTYAVLEGADGLSLKATVAGTWLTASAWEKLAALARLGDGILYLTAHGNLRVRGLGETQCGDAVRLLTELAALLQRDDVQHCAVDETTAIGWHEDEEGNVELGAVFPLGRLSAQVADIFGVLGARVRTGRDGRVLVAGLEAGIADQALRVLAPAGMVFDASSPWCQVSACVAAPRCPHGLTAVEEDAAHLVRSGVAQRTHLVGCEQRCAEPDGAHVLYIASGEGEYDVQEVQASGAEGTPA